MKGLERPKEKTEHKDGEKENNLKRRKAKTEISLKTRTQVLLILLEE